MAWVGLLLCIVAGLWWLVSTAPVVDEESR
jgi:hypothetical protein